MTQIAFPQRDPARCWLVLVLSVVLLGGATCFSGSSAAAKPIPPEDERQITRWVAVLLREYHLSGQRKIDAEKWERSVDIYLKTRHDLHPHPTGTRDPKGEIIDIIESLDQTPLDPSGSQSR